MTTPPLLTLRTATEVSHQIQIKRSRFIATLARTDDPTTARELIDRLRRAHPQARHTCSAFIIDQEERSPLQHSSDDGEPSGTAGAPMLEVLNHAGLSNVTAVVTRYFGGTLLGTGGLARAYGEAVSTTLAAAPLVEIRTLDVLELVLDPVEAGRIEAELRQAKALILSTTWTSHVTLRIACTPADQAHLAEVLARASQGRTVFRATGTTRLEVDVSGASA